MDEEGGRGHGTAKQEVIQPLDEKAQVAPLISLTIGVSIAEVESGVYTRAL